VYGELVSCPPPLQPAPSAFGNVRWSIPDSGSLEVPVTVKPPALPCRMYTVVPVALAFVNDPNERLGADGALGSLTVIAGDEARLVSVPPEEDFSCACHVCAAAVPGAVAPEPPPPVEPYVIVKVDPPERLIPETVIVWLEALTLPVLDVV